MSTHQLTVRSVGLFFFLAIICYATFHFNYQATTAFMHISFSSNASFTSFDPASYRELPNCSHLYTLMLNHSNSFYNVSISSVPLSYASLQLRHASRLHLGGHFYPSHCRPQQRVAIIIAHRNREQHLQILLDYLHPFLQQQLLDYVIFVIHQDDNLPFNRGALFNIGFIQAQKHYPFDCFIFHDVDLIPLDLRNLYLCTDQVRHMAVAIDKFNYKLPYASYFGGVTAYSPSDYIDTNGYSTVYWGWGGEDDDGYRRVTRQLNKSIVRHPVEIGRYKMIRSHGHESAKVNPYRFELLESKYQYGLDGLNTTKYMLNSVRYHQLFTLIDVSLINESIEHIRTRLHIKKSKKT